MITRGCQGSNFELSDAFAAVAASTWTLSHAGMQAQGMTAVKCLCHTPSRSDSHPTPASDPAYTAAPLLLNNTNQHSSQTSSGSKVVDVLQELLLRLVEDYYPLPTNPSQEPPANSHPHPHSDAPNGTAGKAEGAMGRGNSKKRKGSKAPSELSPKSRRTKKSIKAGKGVQQGQLKAEDEDNGHAAGEAIPAQQLTSVHDPAVAWHKTCWYCQAATEVK